MRESAFPLLISVILLFLIIYTSIKIIHFFPSSFIAGLFITILVFVLMLGSELLYHHQNKFVNSRILRTFAWIGSVTMGIWTTFILLSLIFDLSKLLIIIVEKFYDNGHLTEQVNILFRLWLPRILLIISVFLVLIGIGEAAKGPKLKYVIIPLPGLPPNFTGLKIVQISDLHAGLLIRKKYLEKMVEMIIPLAPDIIVLTGDLADGTPENLSDHLSPLRRLKAKYGKYFVTGNHEYYWGVDLWVNYVADLGFIPLLNENQILKIKGAKIMIAGITDPTGKSFSVSHHPNINKALFTPEQYCCKILLAHNPSIWKAAEKAGFDLQLSGHTHAGQFFPFNLLLPLVHKYRHGLHWLNSMWLYINAGTGTWGPFNRLGISSEITVINLITQHQAIHLLL